MNRSKPAAVALTLGLSLLSPSCGNRGGGGAPDAGRRAVTSFPAGAVEHRVDTTASTVTISVAGGLDPGSVVSGTFSLRGGALTLSNASLPAAKFFVDLTSFDSHLPVRNERVKQVFFETTGSGGDSAEITIERLPEEALAKLKARKLVAGARTEATLTVHGRTTKVALTVDAGFNERGVLWVKTSAPAPVNITELGMGENKKRLMATCQHEHIDDVVKVEASLELTPM
jgi:hypothetical protein